MSGPLTNRNMQTPEVTELEIEHVGARPLTGTEEPDQRPIRSASLATLWTLGGMVKADEPPASGATRVLGRVKMVVDDSRGDAEKR